MCDPPPCDGTWLHHLSTECKTPNWCRYESSPPCAVRIGSDVLTFDSRLFLSFRSRILIVLDGSFANKERELGLDRRETG